MSHHRIGLYPGTFDPITLGHVDIISRAAKLVDKLVVGIAVNADKEPLFSLEERVGMTLTELQPLSKSDGRGEIEVRPFDHLLVQFAEEIGASVILRGLRAVADFEYEFQMVGMNSYLNAEIETVFLMADVKYQPIASRLVKEIARLGGDVSSFVTPQVVALLEEKYSM